MSEPLVAPEMSGGIPENLDLMPDAISDGPNVRPTLTDKKHKERVKRLAKSIEQLGQTQPARVRQTETGFELIDGHGRRDAVRLLNEASPENLRTLWCVVDNGPEANLWAKSVASNFHTATNALEMSKLLIEAQERIGLNKSGLAEFFGISPALVTQHYKLLDAKGDLKAKLIAGEISMDAALELLKLEPELQEQVLESATQSAAAEPQPKPKKSKVTVATPTEDEPEADSKPEKPSKPKVEKKHIAKAVRETGGKAKRSPKDNREFWEALDAPIFGGENSDVRKFVRYYLGWLDGNGTDRTLEDKFEGILSSASKKDATPEKAEKKPEKKADKKADKKPPAKAKK